MKVFLFISLMFIATSSFCQSDEIYRLTFSNPSNFKLTTELYKRKQPAYLWIVDTTDIWRTERFWIKELNNTASQVIKTMEEDEHHPYNHTYLFRDTILSKLIEENERRKLCTRAGELKSTKLVLKGRTYSTAHSEKKLEGFYFTTTEPLFSSDGKYSFIDITVFYRERADQELNDTYFGTVCIIYEKHKNTWKKIIHMDFLIL